MKINPIKLLFSAFLLFIPLSQAITEETNNKISDEILKTFIFNKPGQDIPGRIAFTAKINNFYSILALDLRAGTVTALVTGNHNNSYPSWSPDGTELVFSSDRTGHEEIFKIKWDGTALTQLTNSLGSSGNPDWSHDGKTISYFYTAPNQTETSQIHTLNLSDLKTKALTAFKGKQVTPRLSPDNNYMAYSTNRIWPGWDVCLLNLTTKKEACPLGGKDSFCRPAWNKAGNKLLFASGFGNNINIGALDTTTNGSIMITNLPNREYDPIWGPNDEHFFFVAEPEQTDKFDLFIMIYGDKQPRKLLASPYSVRYPSWNPKTTLELEAQKIREQNSISGINIPIIDN
jgi:Tol biopolymer transport system component